MAFDGSIKIDTKIDNSGLNRQISQLKASLQGVGASIERMAGAAVAPLIGLSVPLGLASKGFLDLSIQIDSAQIALTRMLGGADKAGTLIKDLKTFGAETPFEFPGLLENTKKLIGFGIAGEDVIATLKMLGNAAGGNQEKLNTLALAYGKIRARGKASMEELNMLLEAGVPVLDELAKGYGVTTQEVLKFVEQGKVGFGDVQKALRNLTTGTGQFAGILEDQSKALGGLWSTAKDDINNFGVSLVKSLEPTLIGIMKNISALANFLSGLSNTTKSYLAVMVAVVTILPIAALGFGQMLKAITAVREGLALLTAAQRAQAAAIGGFAALVMGVFLAINYAMDKAAESYNKYVDKLDAANLPLSEANAAIKANKQEVKDMTHELENQKKVLRDLENFRAQNKITTLSQDELDVKGNILMLEEKISKAKENQVKIMNRLDKAQFGGKGEKAPKIDLTGIEKPLEALKKAKKAKDDVFNVDDNMENYGEAIGVINNKIKDGIITEEEGRQSIIDLTEQQIQALYEQGATIANVNDESASTNDQVLRSLTESLDRMKLTGAAAFFVGAGIPVNIAKGVQSGLHYVTSAVKKTVEMMAKAFDVTIAIFAGAFDVMSWMTDFDPSAMFDDISTFITGLIDFFEKDLGSIPIFAQMALGLVTSLIDTINKNLPVLLETIGNVIDMLVTYFVANAPTIIDSILKLVVSIATVLLQKVPDIFNAIMVGIIAFLQSFGDASSGLTQAFVDAIVGIVNSLAQNLPAIIQALVVIFVAIFNGIVDNLPQIIDALIGLIVPLTTALIEALPVIIEALVAALPDIIVAIIKALPELLVELVKATVIILLGLVSTFAEVGKYIVLGIANGIKDAGARLWNSVKSVFTNFINKIKGLFRIASPSKLFFDFGVNIIKGMINGIMSMGSALLNAFNSIFNGIKNLVSNLRASFINIGASIGSAIAQGVTSSLSTIGSAMSSVLSSMTSALSNMIQTFKEFGSRFVSSLVSGISSSASSLATKLFEVLQSAVSQLFYGIKDAVWGWIKGWFSNIADGTWAYLKSKVKDMIPGSGGGWNPFDSSAAPVGSSAAVSSIQSGISGGSNLQSAAPTAVSVGTQTINLNNTMTGNLTVDGRVLGKIAFENIDRYYKAAYGS